MEKKVLIGMEMMQKDWGEYLKVGLRTGSANIAFLIENRQRKSVFGRLNYYFVSHFLLKHFNFNVTCLYQY